MEGRFSTQELFDELDTDSREEAVRLAARLQESDDESADLLAAAYEAGVEDRYLRLAVERMKAKRTASYPAAHWLPALTLVLFVFTQGYVAAATFIGAQVNLWPAFLLAAASGIVLASPRPRWLAPIAVLATWAVLIGFFSGMDGASGRATPEMALLWSLRIAGVQAALAYAGGVLAAVLASRRLGPRRASPPALAPPADGHR